MVVKTHGSVVRPGIEYIEQDTFGYTPWPFVLVQVSAHVVSFVGLYLMFAQQLWAPLMFTIITTSLSVSLGIGMGGHRYYSHRSFKATLPLRLIIIFCNTYAAQQSIYTWAMNHRVHHKFVDGAGDPYCIKRGVFFAHIQWVFMKPHPAVKRAMKVVDGSDMLADPLIYYQDKYYFFLSPLIGFLLPMAPLYYWWNVPLLTAVTIAVFRIVYNMHIVSFVNSWAHLYGDKPYDDHIMAVETLSASIVSFGEGYHNFHHVFPFDYRAAEYSLFNYTRMFIELFYFLGMAYDLKMASENSIKKSRLKNFANEHVNEY